MKTYRYNKIRDILLIGLSVISISLFISGKIIQYNKYNSTTNKKELKLIYQPSVIKPIFATTKKEYIKAWFNDNNNENISSYINMLNLYNIAINQETDINMNLDNKCFIEHPKIHGQSGCFITKNELIQYKNNIIISNDTIVINNWNILLEQLIIESNKVNPNGIILGTRKYTVSESSGDHTFSQKTKLSSFYICTQTNWDTYNIQKEELAIISNILPTTYNGLNCSGAVNKTGQLIYKQVPTECTKTDQKQRCQNHKINKQFLSVLNYNNISIEIPSMYSQVVQYKNKLIYEVPNILIFGYRHKIRIQNTVNSGEWSKYKINKKENKYDMEKYYLSYLNIDNIPGISVLFVLLQFLILILITFYINRKINNQYDILLYITRHGSIYIIWIQLLLFYYFNFDYYELLRIQNLSFIETNLQLWSILILLIIVTSEIIHTRVSFTGYNLLLRILSYVCIISYIVIFNYNSEKILNIKEIRKEEEKIKYKCEDVNLCYTGHSYLLVILLPIFVILIILRIISKIYKYIVNKYITQINFDYTSYNESEITSFEKYCIGGKLESRLPGYDLKYLYIDNNYTAEAISLLGFTYIDNKYLIRKKDILYLSLFIIFKNIVFSETINMSLTMWELEQDNGTYYITNVYHIYYNNISKSILYISNIGNNPVLIH